MSNFSKSILHRMTKSIVLADEPSDFVEQSDCVSVECQRMEDGSIRKVNHPEKCKVAHAFADDTRVSTMLRRGNFLSPGKVRPAGATSIHDLADASAVAQHISSLSNSENNGN